MSTEHCTAKLIHIGCRHQLLSTKTLYSFTFAKHHHDHMEGSPGQNLPEMQKEQCFFSFKHILFIKQTYFSKQTKMTQRTNKQKKRKTYVKMPHCNTVALPVPIATYLMWKGLMVKPKLKFAIFSMRVHWWIIASESLCTVLTQPWLFRCLCPVCGWVKSFSQNMRQCKFG